MIKLRGKDFSKFIIQTYINGLELIKEACNIYCTLPAVRNTTVLFLASLGIEEFGKATYAALVLGTALENGSFNKKDYITLDDAFKHQQKQLYAFLGLLPEVSSTTIRDFFPEVANIDKERNIILHKRKDGLWDKRNRWVYVDYDYQDGKILLPEVLKEREAKKWLKIAIEVGAKAYKHIVNSSTTKDNVRFEVEKFHRDLTKKIENGVWKRLCLKVRIANRKKH